MRKLLLLFVCASFLTVGCSDDGATVTEVDDADIAVTVDEMDEDEMDYLLDDENVDDGYEATPPVGKREPIDDDGDGFDDVETDRFGDEDDVDGASGDDLH